MAGPGQVRARCAAGRQRLRQLRILSYFFIAVHWHVDEAPVPGIEDRRGYLAPRLRRRLERVMEIQERLVADPPAVETPASEDVRLRIRNVNGDGEAATARAVIRTGHGQQVYAPRD